MVGEFKSPSLETRQVVCPDTASQILFPALCKQSGSVLLPSYTSQLLSYTSKLPSYTSQLLTTNPPPSS